MNLLAARVKFPLHMVQLAFVLGALGGTAARLLFVKAPAGAPPSRANTMALGMGAKSIIIILYQVLTEKVNSCKKWGSLKAYLILNCLEIVFWAAVAFMMVQANLNFCQGMNCTISWGVIVVAGQISLLALWASIISWIDFKYHKATGMHRGEEAQAQVQIKDEESGDAMAMQNMASGGRRY